MLQVHRNAQLTFLRSEALDAVPGVAHAFSTRRGDGDGFTLGAPTSAGEDERSRFLAAAGMAGWPLARVRQVHSNVVHSVETNEFANELPEGDALVSRLPGLALGILTADCVPILIAEEQGAAVAAAHAGWRGTSEGIARRAVEVLESEGIEPERLWVSIGPHIGVCCMEVGEEVFDWFAQPEVFERRPEWKKPHLDLARANELQLASAGVRPDRIQASALSTRCRPDLFFSYRRDGETTGRMLAAIGLEP